MFVEGELFGFCGSIAHKSDIGGPVPGSCSGQAREIFNEGLHLPAVRYQQRATSRTATSSGSSPPTAAPRSWCWATSAASSAPTASASGGCGSSPANTARPSSLACFDAPARTVARRQLRAAIAEWPDGRFEAERFVDDDGIDLNEPVRIHVVVDKRGDRTAFRFHAAPPTRPRGPANIRPPLVQAACAYALISLLDPRIVRVSSGLLDAFTIDGARRAAWSTRASRRRSTPTTRPSTRWSTRSSTRMSQIVPASVPGRRQRQPLDHHRRPQHLHRKGYVQYEIFGGGAGARASKDGVSGITVNQSNAKIAPVEIIESEFPDARHALRADPGFGRRRASIRGGLGIRREYLNLADARFSIRSMKHMIPPHGCAGGSTGRTGRHLDQSRTGDGAKRLPTRYADYPLKAGDVFRLDTPGGGGYGDPLARDPERVLATCARGIFRHWPPSATTASS